MALYKPEQLGIKATTTGGVFKQGAWYNARQYWNGTLGEPGVIHPESNQQGAGQPVSQEVVRASSVAAGKPADAYSKYIAAGAPVTGYNPNTGKPTTQQNSSQVTDLGAVLNGVQTSAYETPGVQTAAEILADLKASGLFPAGEAPTPPNLSQQYQDLITAQGVPAIQTAITDLKAQADALVAQTRTNVSAERGKPVAENVIEGRVGVQQKQSQEQLDFINRQLTVKQNELTAALTNIQTIMNLTQTDYQNASDAYNKKFEQAITTINLVHGIQQDQKTDVQRAQDNARANAQILYNAIREGGLSMNNLPADAKAQLNSLEVQSGLPLGFFQSIKADPKADIIATSSYEGQTQVLFRNQDGSVSVQTYGTRSGSGSTNTSNRTAIVLGLQAAANKSGHVTPDIFKAALNAYIADGLGDKKSFVENFYTYADYNRGDFKKAYGFDPIDYGLSYNLPYAQ